jgi:hypothetical protein
MKGTFVSNSALLAVGMVATFVRSNPGGPIFSLANPPVVYYYMPSGRRIAMATGSVKVQERAALHPVHKQMLGGNETEGDDKFVCTVANIQALSAETQAKWDKCKDKKGRFSHINMIDGTAHPQYTENEPNKNAKRRLLGWVWEPDQKNEKKSPMPTHLPTHYRLKLEEGLRTPVGLRSVLPPRHHERRLSSTTASRQPCCFTVLISLRVDAAQPPFAKGWRCVSAFRAPLPAGVPTN